MARFYFQGFDGKWYVADDHTTSMLEVLQRRMDGAYKRLMEKEAQSERAADGLSQCKREKKSDDH